MTIRDNLFSMKDAVSRGEFPADVSARDLGLTKLANGEGFPVIRAMYAAFNGSLDAAKQLHDAVMPVPSRYWITPEPTRIKVDVCAWPNGQGGLEIQGDGWSEENPARGWLLAILDALLKMEAA